MIPTDALSQKSMCRYVQHTLTLRFEGRFAVVAEAQRADAVAGAFAAAGEKILRLGEIVAAQGAPEVVFTGALDLGG